MCKYKYTISCVVCGKSKETNKLKTRYCSNACRQSMYRNGVTDDAKSLRNKYNALRNYVDSLRQTASKEYSILLVELAQIRGKDDNWIKKTLKIHEELLISDAHHGYNEQEGLQILSENIHLFSTQKKSKNNSK